MEKTCINCGEADQSKFYETQTSRYCKDCHKARYFGRGRARCLAAKLARVECRDCHLKVTEDNASIFDFDHTQEKRLNVSSMVTYKDETFNEELKKCELVCANCHRLRTMRRGYFRGGFGRPRKTSPGETPANTRPPSADAPPPLLLG